MHTAPPQMSPEKVLMAYTQGFFPMPDHASGQMHWFRPDPRGVIPLEGFHLSRSLAKVLRKGLFHCTLDQAFDQVMEACANRPETWITQDILKVYGQLHRTGYAHSLEIWHHQDLVGGVYGIALGGAFFAESMFHKVSNASKVALYELVQVLIQQGFVLLECQFLTDHLKSLGAIDIPDHAYIKLLEQALTLEVCLVS